MADEPAIEATSGSTLLHRAWSRAKMEIHAAPAAFDARNVANQRGESAVGSAKMQHIPAVKMARRIATRMSDLAVFIGMRV